MASTHRDHRRHLDLAVVTLDAYKLARGCVDCGYNTHPGALQFDHREPATKHTVDGWVRDRSKLTTRSRLERYLDHVDACCDVRCANCHAVRTITERHWLPSAHRQAEAPGVLF